MAKTPKAKGRPSKFTPEIRKALIDAITAGLTYTHACQIVGIDYVTFTNWRNKGEQLDEEDEEGFFDFFNALTRAETKASTAMMAHIRAAAQGDKKNGINPDWRAAAWWLERRYPDEYGKQKLDINHSGKVSLSWADMVKQASEGDRDDND